MISRDMIAERYDYNPETGWFTFKDRSPDEFKSLRMYRIWRARFVGTVAGSLNGNGYVRVSISVDGKPRDFRAHRLAWLYMTGTWPEAEIDHIDGDRSNNSWSNLREATRIEQCQNLAVRSDNSTGFTGVWKTRFGKFDVRISKGGRHYRLGTHDTAEEAYAAYLAAKSNLHTFNPIPRYEQASR